MMGASAVYPLENASRFARLASRWSYCRTFMSSALLLLGFLLIVA